MKLSNRAGVGILFWGLWSVLPAPLAAQTCEPARCQGWSKIQLEINPRRSTPGRFMRMVQFFVSDVPIGSVGKMQIKLRLVVQ